MLLHDETIDVVARANVPAPGEWAPGGDLDQDVVGPLAEAGIPFLEGSETALLALRNLHAYRAALDRPSPPGGPAPERPVGVTHVPRGVLTGIEAMRLLREFGIPLVQTRPARDAEQAVHAAERLGYPVALKVDSHDIAHKTDVGGVRLACADGAAVRQGVRAMLDEVRPRAPAARIDGVLVQPMLAGGTEMIVGIKRDPPFGPAIVCGFGGIFVEVLRDAAVRVPPLDRAEALAMLAEVHGGALMRGVRGRPPPDVDALADTLVGVARLVEAHRTSLLALDINPLVVLEAGHGAVAVDWLIELG